MPSTVQIGNDVVALLFSIHMWGGVKTANKALIETDADKSMLKLSKSLIDSKEFQDVKTFLNSDVKEWVRSRSVPSFFRDGCYLVRLSVVEEIEKTLRMYESVLRGKVMRLVEVYPSKIREAQERLGNQFNPNDYPTETELDKLFYWSYQWVSFNVPEGLPEGIREEAIRKMENMWDDAAQSITSALRESFANLISHAVERLETKEDGKVKKFNESLVTNITDFLETFNKRNVVNDVELSRLVDKAKSVIGGVDEAQALRDNESLRNAVRDGFKAIEEAMVPLVVPKRKFDL